MMPEWVVDGFAVVGFLVAGAVVAFIAYTAWKAASWRLHNRKSRRLDRQRLQLMEVWSDGWDAALDTYGRPDLLQENREIDVPRNPYGPGCQL